MAVFLLVGIPIVSRAADNDTKSVEADPLKTLVSRLDLDKYKATIKGLTKFGDRDRKSVV